MLFFYIQQSGLVIHISTPFRLFSHLGHHRYCEFPVLYSRSILVTCVFVWGQKSRSSDLGSSGPRSQPRDGQFSHPKTGGYTSGLSLGCWQEELRQMYVLSAESLGYSRVLHPFGSLHVLATWQFGFCQSQWSRRATDTVQVSGKRPITSSQSAHWE